MRAALLPLAAAACVVAAGCGQQTPRSAVPRADDARSLSAYGVNIKLPEQWSGRILLGAEGRPVLHAASFPLPPSDDDSGQLAQETIGSRGQMYVNVRDRGPGDATSSLPVQFEPSDFEPPGPGMRCCFIRVATRDVAALGHTYRIAVASGSDEAPPGAALAEVNALLKTLSVEPHVRGDARSLPADARTIDGYGISMRLPSGWDGRVSQGRVEAASSAGLGPGEIRLRLFERGAVDASFATRAIPIELSQAEFVPPSGGLDPAIPAMTGGSFVMSGRQFMFSAEAGSFPPSSKTVEQANQALATIRVRPGDFYPGAVQPAAFASADGWHTGRSAEAERQPEGQQTWTWASTVAYVDELPQSLPTRTLERLAPDGVVIRVQLYGPDRPAGRSATPPFSIAQATRAYPWEGQIGDIPLYTIAGRVPGQAYNVDISVFFGRNRPTRTQIALANAELGRLRLPDWAPADR